ncbi:MAG TPA: hypothetical protein VFI47_01140 [Acidimicrobiales bacterium]|nr:hypothetical protein [Acidimicrobiales bacterium]
MPTDDQADPGADTAMFRAYVEHNDERAPAAPAGNRTAVIAVVAAVLVVVLLAILLLA